MSLSRTFLSIGIAIVFAAFIIYGLNVVYEPPKYDYSQSDCHIKYDCFKPINDCQKKYEPPANATQPVAIYAPSQESQECYTNITKTPEFMACQEASEKCNEEFQKKSPQYRRAKITFVVFLIIGIAAIVGGSMMAVEGVGAGFIGGGVLVILWSVVSSWMYLYSLDKYLKLAGLGVVLAVLIYLGYKKMEKTR